MTYLLTCVSNLVGWGDGKISTSCNSGFAAPHHAAWQPAAATFFNDEDYAAYLELMAQWCRDEGVEIWSYCLMPDHIHLIAVPSSEKGLRWAIGEAHRLYTRRINFRQKWRGYLWQGRFASFVMDEPYLLAAARYIELNPLRAGLVADPRDWPWSSAAICLAETTRW